jgi:anthranilate synthase/aminodeoxychorismate synthase-like glutamine amidotransferase
MGANVDVVEDKKVVLAEVEHYDCIVFSPGPGLPRNTRSMFPVLEKYEDSKRILGICLGMQGIAEFFGAKLYNQQQVKHGVAETIRILKSDNLFHGFPSHIKVGLYHSWAVDLMDCAELKATSNTENGVTMSFEHISKPIYGVQFHPESILTDKGKELLSNFIFPN